LLQTRCYSWVKKTARLGWDTVFGTVEKLNCLMSAKEQLEDIVWWSVKNLS